MLKYFIATLACALLINVSALDNFGRKSNRANLLSKAVGARMLAANVPTVDSFGNVQTVQGMDNNGQFVPINRVQSPAIVQQQQQPNVQQLISGNQQLTPEQLQQLQQLINLQKQQQQQQTTVQQQQPQVVQSVVPQMVAQQPQTVQRVQQGIVQQGVQQGIQAQMTPVQTVTKPTFNMGGVQQLPTSTAKPNVLEQQLFEQQALTQRLQEQLKVIQQQQQQKLQQQQVQNQNLLQQLQQFENVQHTQPNQIPMSAPVELPQRVTMPQTVQAIANNTMTQQIRMPQVQTVQQQQQFQQQQLQQQQLQQQQLQMQIQRQQQQQQQQQVQNIQKVQSAPVMQQQQQTPIVSHVGVTGMGVTGVNDDICMNVQQGELLPHPSDPSQFIICYGLGEFTVMDCPEMLVYNPHLKRCDLNTELPLLCKSNPCMNGGKCVELNQVQFKCECNPGFGGQMCEKLDTCSTRPCGNDGVCIPFVLGSPIAHVCLCNGGKAVGSSCQRTEMNPCMTPGSNSRLMPVAMNPSVFAHCEGSRPHFKFCQPPLVFSAAKQECEWA